MLKVWSVFKKSEPYYAIDYAHKNMWVGNNAVKCSKVILVEIQACYW